MRIILCLLTIGLYLSPAYAYKEDNRIGETQLTAGEQNSALHRLNDKSDYIIKQLKKADEYVARKKNAGREVVVSNLESLLHSEQEDKEKQEMQRISSVVAEKIGNMKALVATTDRAVYENLERASEAQVKDTQIARTIRQQFKRGGR